MRAYYRDSSEENLNLPHDSGQPVSEQKLEALGWKVWKLDVTDPDCMNKHRKHARESGFVDGSAREHLWDFKDNLKSGAPGTPDMVGVSQFYNMVLGPYSLLLRTLMMHSTSVIPFDKMVAILHGIWFCDVKEPETNAIIRILVEPGDQYFIPAGTIAHFHPHVDTMHDTSVFIIYKTTQTFEQHPPWVHGHDHELHNHPIRTAYLKK
ncbi:hypothetical protein L218DRAFT_992353 [Marasmius fiardii PR-910]|nr:hypothetical protein L218DRAFT_992353 [Marasmius fiardii PR-910]